MPAAKFALFICFLHAKNMSAAEINCELCASLWPKCNERRNCKTMVKNVQDGQTQVCGRPTVVSDHLVQSVDQKICDARCFTISELSREFP
jgi:hypothetical protein